MVDATSRLVISGFGDEISDDLETQLEVMTDLGLSHLDLRSLNGTNVLELTDTAIAEIQDTIDATGFAVASIGSPIGKVSVEAPFDPEVERLESAIQLAETFDTEYIRVFSYYIPTDDDPSDWRADVLDRLSTLTHRAEAAGVTLLLENEQGLYGDTPNRCRDILTSIDSSALRANFDPANYVVMGIQPYPDALLQLVEFIDYLHIKDATFGENPEIRPAGEGDANIPAIIKALHTRGFTGVTALEPHLETAGSHGGFSGPDGFRRAADAFIDILHDLDVRYH